MKKKFFKSLKVTNIYLKSVNYSDFNNHEIPKNINISKDIHIDTHEGNNVSFLVEHKILINEGKKSEIVVLVAIDINIDINEGVSEDLNDDLKQIAQKIIEVNFIYQKISLLVGNITNSLGDIPIILPDETYTRKEDENNDED